MNIISASEIVVRRGANTFPKYSRLRSASDFRRVYNAGAKRTSPSFVVFALGNGLDYSRFGLTTPRNLGKAHDRNRIRRRVKEVLRTSSSLIPPGFDFVVNPRRSSRMTSDFKELRSQLIDLLGAQR